MDGIGFTFGEKSNIIEMRPTQERTNEMNGLEAIELMKQGKMVIEVGPNEPFILKIENGVVWFKNSTVLNSEWVIDDYFDFTINYEEYIEKQLTGWERVSENETYYSINGNCYVEVMNEDMCMEDKYSYEDANYFSTEDKAEEINFKQTLFRKLQRFSDKNGGNGIDWKDFKEHKYFIGFDYSLKGELYVDYCFSVRQFSQVYFVSREVAEKAIELFKEDLIKYFTI